MKKITPKVSESDIQKTVCEFLELLGIFFWRQNTAPAFDWKTNQFRRMAKYTRRGIPDIIAIIDGKFVGFEIKSKTGKLSEDQKSFCLSCELAGGYYFVIKSLEDIKEALKICRENKVKK
jgi:hypothetical protein